MDIDLVQTPSHDKPHPNPHPVIIASVKNTVISTQYFGWHHPLNTYAMSLVLQDRTVTILHGRICPRVQFGTQHPIPPYAYRFGFCFCLHNHCFSTFDRSSYVSRGCVNKRKLFRRILPEKPLKSADSAVWLPAKNLTKTIRAKKRDIPYLRPTKETHSRLKKSSMENIKCEKRDRKLTRKAKRARVKFITDDSSSTNSAEENQFRPGNLNVKLYNPTKTLPQKNVTNVIRLYKSSKRSLHCLHLDHHAPSKSPLKRSHMARDTTYIVNLDTDRSAAPAQITQSDLPTLSVTVNASDDLNNNDVITGMEPTERSQRRNDAIEAMELAGGGSSSPTDSPLASTSCAVLPQPVSAYALLPTPLRQEIGYAEAHNLALAAIANALATEQLDRVQPHPAEPHSPTHHSETMNPDPMAEDPHDPQSVLVNGGLSVTTLDDTVFEHDTVEIEAETVESEAEPNSDEVTPLYCLLYTSDAAD